MSFTPINGYGWDQKDQLVKVYLTKDLDGIGKHDKEAVQCEFEADSCDLKIRNFNGKHYRLRLTPLAYHIDPALSKIQVKSNSITISLKKAEMNHWMDVLKKAKKGDKPGKKGGAVEALQAGEDPQASLMGMMKDLYNSGDDEMKKTIAESWGKA